MNLYTKMKVLFGLWILLLVLMFISSSFAQSVWSEEQRGNIGIYVRIVNGSPYNLGCYINDGFNYHRFIVYGQSVSIWYPVNGPYEWQCQ